MGPIVLAVIVLLLIPVGPVFLPFRESPRPADVIFVLGPATESRMAFAERLVSDGYADTLVISAAQPGPGRAVRLVPICSDPTAARVHCQQSEPFTTQGEVSMLERMASQQSWETAIIITETTHVQRARLYAARCFSGESQVLADESQLSPDQVIYEYAYETAGFLKAFFLTPGCAGG